MPEATPTEQQTVTPQVTLTPRPTAQPTLSPTPLPAFGMGPQGATTEATVVRIVDGDTIHVRIGGTEYALRYIGIDSPESGSEQADEATAVNVSLVDGKSVLLESDVNDTDPFDRLLRYVWLAQGSSWLLVNRELVRLGAAVSKAYPPDTKYQALFDAAQAEARAGSIGVWTAVPAPPDATPASNCDPSYPSVCIPPFPPDLNCGDISFRRFAVLQPDPHGFDGNQDGVGCES